MRRIVLHTLFVAATFLLAASSTASAKIIYVDDDAPAPGDGTSWATAYRFLQDALADANDSDGSAEIRVAQGTYKPDRSSNQPAGTDDRTSCLRLLDSMTIKGGYAGIDAPDANARDVEAYATILTGDLADNDVPIEDPWPPFGIYPTRIDNSFCMLTADIADSNATLDGIVITRTSLYRPDGEPLPERSGGLYVGRYTRVVVRNCVFTENVTPGVHCFGATELTVVDCTFRDNIYRYGGGGGIHIRASTADVIGCTFERNRADEGGGIYNWSDYGYLRVEDCVFHGNATEWSSTGFGIGPYVSGGVGGGLSSTGAGELRRCEFQGNHAAAGGAANLVLDWTISDCIFHDNWSYESGGALLLQFGNKEISRCAFIHNACHWEGGAVGNRGCHINFTACVFAGNAAVYGGVISARDVRWCHIRTREWMHRGFPMALNNCTIADNLSGEGPRIWCSGWYVTDDSEAEGNALNLSNCILDNGGDEIRYRGEVQISIAHTNLRGGLDSIPDPCECVVWGPGNLDVDPLFATSGYWDPNDMPDFTPEVPWSHLGAPDALTSDSFTEGDYHLKSQAGRWDAASEGWVQDDVTSLCIDAGDPNSPVGDEPFPNGGVINMGAYGGTAQASMSPARGPTEGQWTEPHAISGSPTATGTGE
jgi:Right handed beta helix region/Disaggregatase related